jgi:hypothetical protein
MKKGDLVATARAVQRICWPKSAGLQTAATLTERASFSAVFSHFNAEFYSA